MHRRHRAAISLQAQAKVQLYWALQEAGITRAELMRRLGWKRESVDRLFRLDHATRIDQYQAAFDALRREVEIRVR
jgi:antitoxin HicB